MNTHLLLALAAASMLATVSAQAEAEKSDNHFYFGAAYEMGSLQFKSGHPYADSVSGISPIIGIDLSKHFAFEGTWTWFGGENRVSDALSYHSSGRGLVTKVLVKLPLGDSGVSPFIGAGASFLKLKENSITTTTDPKTKKPFDTWTNLASKMEVFPVGVFGLSYTYGGVELRAEGRIQPVNVNNTGQYLLTYGGGLLFHV